MFKSLRALYTAYGGLKSLLESPYFWISAILAVLVAFSGSEVRWSELGIATIPSLTGFSIAAFAIFFSILSPIQRDTLMKKGEGKSPPLVRLISSVVHAMVIQVTALIFSGLAFLINGRNIVDFINPHCDLETLLNFVFNKMIPTLGTFLIFYSWMLLIGLALATFQLLLLISNATTK